MPIKKINGEKLHIAQAGNNFLVQLSQTSDFV
jgi:hypothetical protein